VFFLCYSNVLLLFSIILFWNKKRKLEASFWDVNISKKYFGLGIEFFLAQFLVLVLNQSNIITPDFIASFADVTFTICQFQPFPQFSS
jgi:hypothetical protein